MAHTPRLGRPVVALAVAVGLGLLAYGGGNVLALWVVLLLGSLGIEFTPRIMIIVSVFTIQLVAFVGVSIAYLRYRNYTLADIGVTLPSLEGWIAIGVGFISVLVLWFLAAVATFIISLRFGIEQPTQDLIRMGQQDPTIFIMMAILSVLIVGPAEELLFRGIIQTRLRETYGVVSGLTLATALFALIHLPGFSESGLIPALLGVFGLFVVGSVLAISYEYTGNLIVPAVIHGLFNAAQGLLGYFSVHFGDDVQLFLSLMSNLPV